MRTTNPANFGVYTLSWWNSGTWNYSFFSKLLEDKMSSSTIKRTSQITVSNIKKGWLCLPSWWLCALQTFWTFVGFLPTTIDISFGSLLFWVKGEILTYHGFECFQRPDDRTRAPQDCPLRRAMPKVAHPEALPEQLSWEWWQGKGNHGCTLYNLFWKSWGSTKSKEQVQSDLRWVLHANIFKDTQQPLKSIVHPNHWWARVFNHWSSTHAYT